MTKTIQSSSTSDLRASLEVVEIKPGKKFSLATLRSLLPDIETLLFFAKVYELDAQQLGSLILKVHRTELSEALFGEGVMHSNELQSFIVGGYDDETGIYYPGIVQPTQAGDVVFDADVPKGEILPHVWDTLEIEVAASIKDVANKLEGTVALLPGKQGQMVFKSLAVMNAKRPTIGDHKAAIHHARQKQNLLILDVSGSMSQNTVSKIVDDVVALSYNANACMAIVSNSTTFWEAGTYDSAAILQKAEFGGTYYDTLADLLMRDWGTVITVADYDSSPGAKDHLRNNCTGHIDQVLDVSLVDRPTYLAECVGQFASEVRPILIAAPYTSLCY